MKFRHYDNSGSLGNRYIFGLNIYTDGRGRFTIDLILGRHVFALIKGEQK